MSATAIHDSTTPSPRLYMAFELGWSQWKLGFATGLDAKPWRRTIPARDLSALQQAVAKARRRFELPDDVAVYSSYGAGRDGSGPGNLPSATHCASLSKSCRLNAATSKPKPPRRLRSDLIR